MEQSNVSNKKSYQLLDMSDSESSSSVQGPPLILTSPRKKRYRKFGNRDKLTEKVIFEKCHIQTRTVCAFFTFSILIIWLLTMSWFINALQNELDKFNHTIITIAAGNRGVPDDLQKCHTISKQLQQNQTDINQRLTVYDGQITNLTLQVNNLGTRLASIEKKINENKDLISSSDATKSINVLPEVAKLGSNYRDLSDSVKSLKDVTSSLKLYQTKLDSNITSINEKLNNVGSVKTDEAKINNLSQNLHKQIDILGNNITKMNENFTSQILWLTNDQKKHGNDIEKLKEDGQNLTSEIKTIENKFTNKFDNVNSKMTSLKTQVDMIASNVTNLHAQSNFNDSLTSSSQLKGEKNGNPTKS